MMEPLQKAEYMMIRLDQQLQALVTPETWRCFLQNFPAIVTLDLGGSPPCILLREIYHNAAQYAAHASLRQQPDIDLLVP
jgi:hypothetical protein